jgi:hypothetical protein
MYEERAVVDPDQAARKENEEVGHLDPDPKTVTASNHHQIVTDRIRQVRALHHDEVENFTRVTMEKIMTVQQGPLTQKDWMV